MRDIKTLFILSYNSIIIEKRVYVNSQLLNFPLKIQEIYHIFARKKANFEACLWYL